MYVNDLRDGLNSTVRLFAYDALLYGTICCDEDAVDLARSILIRSLATKVEEGFPSFKVQDRVPHNQDPPKREYIFCGEILEEVESHPYLGVVFDNE